ncbi:MAG: phosphoglycerate mutase (2,3-diphosphoglycerate-independent) [Deltaproteobacteria bacterium]|nr:MAG: phosphoglycerate mutase (2,3-diphosphoglycerate-independent) [Deltaproteobacteria bacterium]
MTVSRLAPIPGHKRSQGPVILVIMDGVGIGSQDERDGVYLAFTPVLDRLMQTPLVTELKAHGTAVGLPGDSDMGNSEVGHNALGAGRIFSQGAKLVNEALASGKVFQTEEWAELKQRALAGGTLHFIGLLSDGNVHSHIDHLFLLIDQCVAETIVRVRFHILLDGRDVEQKSALIYIDALEKKIQSLAAPFDYQIASGGGRMLTTMDRYNANWDIVERGWKAHVLGIGRPFATASEAVSTYYDEDPELTDQYMDSFVIVDDAGSPVGTIEDGDGVVFFNFRGDRAIEISRAFEEPDFTEFERVRVPEVFYAGMMQYDGDLAIPERYLVQPPAIDRTLGEYFCASGISTYAISETQKYGHVTYFWNGNKSGYIDPQLETYVEIPSDTITFDLKPWMKAGEITDKVIAAVQSGSYDFIRLNFANGDMVGHTGKVAAVRVAVETVDICLGRIEKALKQVGGVLVITADHGNADCLWTEKNGQRVPMVAHTLNPVPFVVVDYSKVNTYTLSGVKNPGLANVAATLCTLLGLTPPSDYEPSLLTSKAGPNSL